MVPIGHSSLGVRSSGLIYEGKMLFDIANVAWTETQPHTGVYLGYCKGEPAVLNPYNTLER